MGKTKFNQLCAAYDAAQDNFDAYKKNCHAFAIELVDELKAYYEIPERQFSLYQVEQNNNFKLINGSLYGALTLTPNSDWHFGVGLTVCKAPESYPEELILIHIFFRKEVGDTFFLRHTYGDKEFEVTKGNKESYIPYFDDLFNTIVDSYQGHIQQFLGEKTTRKLGFVQ
jgi:hypothetical protein